MSDRYKSVTTKELMERLKANAKDEVLTLEDILEGMERLKSEGYTVTYNFNKDGLTVNVKPPVAPEMLKMTVKVE